MKKLTSLLLVLVLVFAMTACGKSSDDNTGTEKKAEGTVKVKAGFICLHDENSTYDKNFIESAKTACENLGVEYEFKTNIPEGQECLEAAEELVDDGCNFIFADSFGHEDFLIQAAQEFPEVQFAHATGTQAHTAGLSNFHNAFASIYEGRYLAGVAAGMKLNEMIENGEITADEAKCGYVGAYPYAEVISGYTSYFLGVRSVCPTATMDVTFTNSWYDETSEKESANKLIKRGCVVISQHADSMGAPTACENAGVYNVSYNGSTEELCPNTYLISTRIDWVPYFEYAIGCVANGEAISTDYTGTLATGSVKVSEPGAAAAEGTAEAIESAKADLMSGAIKVFDVTTFTVNGEALTSYMADVDTDPAYEADHDVIVDGYFNESGEGFRSAPYFDVKIDGITILDK